MWCVLGFELFPKTQLSDIFEGGVWLDAHLDFICMPTIFISAR